MGAKKKIKRKDRPKQTKQKPNQQAKKALKR